MIILNDVEIFSNNVKMQAGKKSIFQSVFGAENPLEIDLKMLWLQSLNHRKGNDFVSDIQPLHFIKSDYEMASKILLKAT